MPNGTGFTYEYFIKDHLGNNRVTLANKGGTAEVMQENHYYPFGLTLTGQTYQNPLQAVVNKYLYNGKEMQADYDLNWYAYGFRMYDPVLGRFPSIDPKAEEFSWVSTYNYAENEPIANIDLWGLQKFNVTDGKLISPYRHISFEVNGGMLENYYGSVREFTTSKGNKFQVQYPTYYKTQEEVAESPLFFVGRLAPEDDGARSNCFGSAFGTGGNILDDSQYDILNDNYTPTNKPKVGSVGVLELEGGAIGHAFEVVDKNQNGALIFKSDWLNDIIVIGTIEKLNEQMNGKIGKDFVTNKSTGTRVNVTYDEYSKWTNSKKQQYTSLEKFEIQDFKWYNPNE